MKKALLVAFCVATLCSVCLIGIANAAKAGYSFIIFSGATPTIDGKWTSLLASGQMLTKIAYTLVGQ